MMAKLINGCLRCFTHNRGYFYFFVEEKVFSGRHLPGKSLVMRTT